MEAAGHRAGGGRIKKRGDAPRGVPAGNRNMAHRNPCAISFLTLSYAAGGSGSLGGSISSAASAFFLRRVSMPTTIGMAMKIMPPHKEATPISIADRGSELPKTSIAAPGIKPAIKEVAPRHKPTRPGHPHRSTATTVPMIAPVLLSYFSTGISIVILLSRFLSASIHGMRSECKHFQKEVCYLPTFPISYLPNLLPSQLPTLLPSYLPNFSEPRQVPAPIF